MISLIALLINSSGAESRTIEIVLKLSVEDIPKDASIDVYIPTAQDSARQSVKKTDIDSNIEGQQRSESIYGNLYWHGEATHFTEGTIAVNLRQKVERNSVARSIPSEKERQLYLKANAKVPSSGEMIDKVIKDLNPNDGSPKAKARSIYDFVVDNMDYKKTGTGWGNGDTEWACSEKYGNCTDFHALFTSVARAQGLPTRFEIGYPVSLEEDHGSIGGYHCWLEVALPEEGWFPIDASEAKKHPEKREAFFGSQPLDRIQFSVGRDLVLEGQASAPLNYFIYPHVEVNGVKWEKVKTEISYTVLVAD